MCFQKRYSHSNKNIYYNESDYYSSDMQHIENFKISRTWFPFGARPLHFDMLDADTCNWSNELNKYIISDFLLDYWILLKTNELNHSSDINHIILVFYKTWGNIQDKPYNDIQVEIPEEKLRNDGNFYEIHKNFDNILYYIVFSINEFNEIINVITNGYKKGELDKFYDLVVNLVCLLVNSLEKEGNKELNKKYFKDLIFNILIPKSSNKNNLLPFLLNNNNILPNKNNNNKLLINGSV